MELVYGRGHRDGSIIPLVFAAGFTAGLLFYYMMENGRLHTQIHRLEEANLELSNKVEELMDGEPLDIAKAPVTGQPERSPRKPAQQTAARKKGKGGVDKKDGILKSNSGTNNGK